MMIKGIIFKLIRFAGIPLLFRELVQKKKVTILMYHDIDIESARKQFRYLKSKYNIISLQSYIEAVENKKSIPQKALVITFDDGHKKNYDLLPLIKKEGIPVTIFICSEIVNSNRHYWFLYDSLKKDSNYYKKLKNKNRLEELKAIGFNQNKEYQSRQSLDENEIIEMSEFIDFQSHTMYHPCLDTCEDEEAFNELSQSKKNIEEKFGFKINAIAFPNGNFNEKTIALTKEAGYQCSLTVKYGVNNLKSDLYRLKRISMNDTNNHDEFVLRSSGVYGFIKSFNN